MYTLTRPAEPTTSGRSALRTATRVLLALFGLLKLTSTTYFLFFASAAQGGDPQGAFDWTVGVWSIVMGAGYLVIAARLGHRALPLAVALTAADLCFSIVKLTVYHESAGFVFGGVSVVLLALVVASERSRRS